MEIELMMTFFYKLIKQRLLVLKNDQYRRKSSFQIGLTNMAKSHLARRLKNAIKSPKSLQIKPIIEFSCINMIHFK